MTPLFKEIYRDKSRKPHKRRFNDKANVVSTMRALGGEVLSFDVSDFEDLAKELYLSADEDLLEKIEFAPLPACGVWLEWGAFATLIMQGRSFDELDVRIIGKTGSAYAVDLKASQGLGSNEVRELHLKTSLAMIYMINTPNFVSFSHVSTPRRARIGAPTSAWMTNPHTKVRLCIDGKVISNNVVGQETGKRPYHYVRGHFRRYWIEGKREFKWIAPHWKGDKSIGTVTKEYECYSQHAVAC